MMLKALQFEWELLRWKIAKAVSSKPPAKPVFHDRLTAEYFNSLVAPSSTVRVPTTEEYFPIAANTTDCAELAECLKRHGSDKATRHSYHKAYAGLLAGRRHEPLRILEIGIGTNDPAVPSSMGTTGRPGASLRAWREWGPRFEVFGADVDKNILFQDDRIRTFWVDQTDPKSFAELEALGHGSFDLIIDDGLHRPDANLNTLAFAQKMLKPDGIFVVEDIVKWLAPFWLAQANVLAHWASATLIFDSKEALFIVRSK